MQHMRREKRLKKCHKRQLLRTEKLQQRRPPHSMQQGTNEPLTELMADLNLRRALKSRSLSMFAPRSRFSSSAGSPTTQGCSKACSAVIRFSCKKKRDARWEHFS